MGNQNAQTLANSVKPNNPKTVVKTISVGWIFKPLDKAVPKLRVVNKI
jgi:hypothetical protein